MTLTSLQFNDANYKNAVKLGAGAFGEVFSAFDIKNNKTIVYKRLDKSRIPEKDLLAEVSVLSQLKDVCRKNILCFIDFMEDRKFFYIIMEYLGEYITLTKYIEKYIQLPPAQAPDWKIVQNLIDGMKDFHMTGVAHRDVKPDNIMINPKNLDIKFIDFGLACRLDTCYVDGQAGTPYYMAPELFSTKDPMNPTRTKYDPRAPNTMKKWMKTDYWSLGATIMELYSKTYFAKFLAESQKLPSNSIDDLKKLMTSLKMNENKIDMFSLFYKQYSINKDLQYKLKMFVEPMLRISPDKRALNVIDSRCERESKFVAPYDVAIKF